MVDMGTYDKQACFKNMNIDIAKKKLILIYKFHSIAVEWDDNRSTGGRVVPKN